MARGSIGFWVNRQPTSVGGYGLLYNWYAIGSGATGIANVGWHVPTQTEFQTLSTYLGGDAVAAGKLKETGFTHWGISNTEATNEVGFNGVGSGARRPALNGFVYLKAHCLCWNEEEYDEYYAYSIIFSSIGSALAYASSADKYQGISIRLLKNSTTLIHGQSGTYTGNDGTVYPTICIGTQEWLAINLKETKYQNGDTIPEVTDNAVWTDLTTGALCAYDNDWSNV